MSNNAADDVISWLPDFPPDKSRGTIGDWFKKTLIKTYVQHVTTIQHTTGEDVKKIYSARLFGLYKAENKDKIIEAVKEFFPIDWAEHSCQMYEENVTFYLSDANGLVALDMDQDEKAISVDYITNIEKIHQHLQDKLGKFIFKRSEENEGKAYVLTSDADGLSTTELGVVGVKLEMDNYSKDIHKEINCVIQDLKSPIPQGRLVILEGEPGGGKTFLVRSLISQVPEAFFVVIPPAMIRNLGDPSIIPILLELKSDYGSLDKKEKGQHGPVVLIVEDADECLTERGPDNMSSISSILNFTSGILGDLLDIRIITTTNAKETEWDPALLRSGRLSDVIHIDELSRQEAITVYRRIMEDDTLDYDGNTLLADIYKLAKEIKKNLELPSEESTEGKSKSTSPIEARLRKLRKTRKIGF